MKLIKSLAFIVFSMALAACGGGGGSAGTSMGISAVVQSAASDFIFELDKTSIVNSGSDKATLTVTVLDKNRNVVEGVPVAIAVDAGAVFTSTSTSTDASGKLAGVISIGSDKSKRTISASIKVNGITKVASVLVSGSGISVAVVPATPAPGQLVTLNLAATDSAGAPIPGAKLTLSGTGGATGTLTTDLSGNQVATFAAPATAGAYTVVAAGLGVSTTKTIQVVAPGGVTLPVVVATVSASSLSAQPSSISPNSTGVTTNRSKLSAKFLSTGNAGIQNMRVRFLIVPPALGNGETISVGDATVYSDASGTAEADYVAGTRSSPTNGVNVRACYKESDFVASDFTAEGLCPSLKSVSATLTVAGSPLSISISDDNKMEKGLGEIAYVKKFLIQVNDSAGVAVKDALVSASVDITHYGKGTYGGSYPLGSAAPTIDDMTLAFSTGTLTVIREGSSPSSLTTAPSTYTSGTTTSTLNVWCVNEDANRNGFLDGGEDRNADGLIQPRKAEIIVSYVNGNKTDQNGQMLVQITYGQNMGSWLSYTLKATTSVAGSEGNASKSYKTDVLEADVENGSFRTPPFGTGACNSRS